MHHHNQQILELGELATVLRNVPPLHSHDFVWIRRFAEQVAKLAIKGFSGSTRLVVRQLPTYLGAVPFISQIYAAPHTAATVCCFQTCRRNWQQFPY